MKKRKKNMGKETQNKMRKINKKFQTKLLIFGYWLFFLQIQRKIISVIVFCISFEFIKALLSKSMHKFPGKRSDVSDQETSFA